MAFRLLLLAACAGLTLLAGCSSDTTAPNAPVTHNRPFVKDHEAVLRFKAKIEDIQPMGRDLSISVTPASSDPRFVISVRILAVDDANPPFGPGEVKHLGIGNPAEFFGPDFNAVIGHTMTFDVNWIVSKDRQWRFRDLHLTE